MLTEWLAWVTCPLWPQWLHLQRRVYRNPLWHLCDFCVTPGFCEGAALVFVCYLTPSGFVCYLTPNKGIVEWIWRSLQSHWRLEDTWKRKSHEREQAVCKLNRSGQERTGCCHPQTEHIEHPGLSVIVDHNTNTDTSYLIVASNTNKEEGAGGIYGPFMGMPLCLAYSTHTPSTV